MNRFLQVAVSCLALVGSLGVLPGVANAAEPNRPAPASIDRDHRGGERDGRWERERHGEGRWEREHRGEHDRVCRVERERGASFEHLRSMGCR